MMETEFAAVSIVLLISFRCFDGSGGFVPVFRWFRLFRLFRFGVPGFNTCPQKVHRYMRKLQKTLGRRKATIKTGKHPVPNYKISVHGFGQKNKETEKERNHLRC